jgi:hypothetical protein
MDQGQQVGTFSSFKRLVFLRWWWGGVGFAELWVELNELLVGRAAVKNVNSAQTPVARQPMVKHYPWVICYLKLAFFFSFFSGCVTFWSNVFDSACQVWISGCSPKRCFFCSPRDHYQTIGSNTARENRGWCAVYHIVSLMNHDKSDNWLFILHHGINTKLFHALQK